VNTPCCNRTDCVYTVETITAINLIKIFSLFPYFITPSIFYLNYLAQGFMVVNIILYA